MALAIEVVRTDNGERETISCASSPVRIGRSPLNNVVLAAPWVSLHHGLIHFDEQHANYSDLGSTNGTTVMVKEQEMKLHPMVPMQILGAGQPTAELRIGVITCACAGRRRPPRRAAGQQAWLRDAPRRGETGRRGRHGAPLPPTSPPSPRVAYEPRGRGARPMYQAGMTRMVMPGIRPACARAADDPVHTAHVPVDRGRRPAPQPDALARLSRAWAATGAAPLQLAGPSAPSPRPGRGRRRLRPRLIELKNGLKEFGEGIGVRAVGGHSPLHRSQGASEILSYLLDPNADTHARLEQLVDLFADLMIHEVALLNGVKAGVRQLLVWKTAPPESPPPTR
jgi:hypothetical protein